MQWSDGKGAGFTEGTPWLALNPNYTEINVEEQENRNDSVLSYYKALNALRKSPEYRETFAYGRFVPAYKDTEGIFAFHRVSEDGKQDILIAANYGKETSTLPLDCLSGSILLSNTDAEDAWDREIKTEGTITLKSCETAVILLRR